MCAEAHTWKAESSGCQHLVAKIGKCLKFVRLKWLQRLTLYHFGLQFNKFPETPEISCKKRGVRTPRSAPSQALTSYQRNGLPHLPGLFLRKTDWVPSW